MSKVLSMDSLVASTSNCFCQRYLKIPIMSKKSSIGKVFFPKNKNIIYKWHSFDHQNYFENEVLFYDILRDSNLVAEMYDHDECDCESSIITLEQYDGDVEDLILALTDIDKIGHIIGKIINLISKLNFEYGVKHNDMKFNNIVYEDIKNKFYPDEAFASNFVFRFIDFSFSQIESINLSERYGSGYVGKYRNWLGSSFDRSVKYKEVTGRSEDLKSLHLDTQRLLSIKKM